MASQETPHHAPRSRAAERPVHRDSGKTQAPRAGLGLSSHRCPGSPTLTQSHTGPARDHARAAQPEAARRSQPPPRARPGQGLHLDTCQFISLLPFRNYFTNCEKYWRKEKVLAPCDDPWCRGQVVPRAGTASVLRLGPASITVTWHKGRFSTRERQKQRRPT